MMDGRSYSVKASLGKGVRWGREVSVLVLDYSKGKMRSKCPLSLE